MEFSWSKAVACREGHVFCVECLKRCVISVLEEGRAEIHCLDMEAGCTAGIGREVLENSLPGDLVRRLEETEYVNNVFRAVGRATACGACGELIVEVPEGVQQFGCEVCGKVTCGFCLRSHEGECAERRGFEEVDRRAAEALDARLRGEAAAMERRRRAELDRIEASDEAMILAEEAEEEAGRQRAAEEARERAEEARRREEAERVAAEAEAEAARVAAEEEAEKEAREVERKQGEEFVAGSSRRCPHCQVPGTKISGCDHITCPRCATHWCYATGLPM
jgi:hypothetical protein